MTATLARALAGPARGRRAPRVAPRKLPRAIGETAITPCLHRGVGGSIPSSPSISIARIAHHTTRKNLLLSRQVWRKWFQASLARYPGGHCRGGACGRRRFHSLLPALLPDPGRPEHGLLGHVGLRGGLPAARSYHSSMWIMCRRRGWKNNVLSGVILPAGRFVLASIDCWLGHSHRDFSSKTEYRATQGVPG